MTSNVRSASRLLGRRGRRHYDEGLEPLHRLMVACTYVDGQTKTRVTRLVPVHHDLRAWFLTQAREDGADPELLEEITHTKKKTVIGGYSRFSWSALCSAMTALRFSLGRSRFAPRLLHARKHFETVT